MKACNNELREVYGAVCGGLRDDFDLLRDESCEGREPDWAWFGHRARALRRLPRHDHIESWLVSL